MRFSRTSVGVLVASCIVLPAPTTAEPRPGAGLPYFTATDLRGRARSSRELSGRPTLVIACTSGGARAAADAWLRAAAGRYRGRSVRVVTLVAIRVPFFVSTDYVRERARSETPSERWGDTWIDAHGRVQDVLGIGDGSGEPWVFTLDGQGRVLSSVHGPLVEPLARAVFSTLPES